MISPKDREAKILRKEQKRLIARWYGKGYFEFHEIDEHWQYAKYSSDDVRRAMKKFQERTGHVCMDGSLYKSNNGCKCGLRFCGTLPCIGNITDEPEKVNCSSCKKREINHDK